MLEIERIVPAAPATVFEAFCDPEKLATWWGPRGFRTPAVELEARVGERYRIEMQPPQGAPFHLTGEFLKVEAPIRLSYTFAWEPPDPDDVETRVELSFQDLGESTKVALTQGPFKTDARRALHRDGWSESFDRLDRLVSAPA